MHDLKDQAPPDTLLAAGRVLATFALSEDVERLVSAHLDELRLTIPLLRPWRGFSSGRWVIGAHTVPDHGSPLPSDYSRVDFEISVNGAVPSVEVTCRSTARGKDRPSRSLSSPLDEQGRQRLAGWVESMLLDFAADYYRRGHGEPGEQPPAN